MVVVGTPDGAAVVGEAPHGPLPAVGANRHRHRHRHERLAGPEREPPLVFGVGGAQKRQIGARWTGPVVLGRGVTAAVFSHLPMPPAIVLDLPHPGVPGTAVDGGAHRQVRPRRPAPGAGQAPASPGVGPMGTDVQVREGVAQGPALPAALGQPIVLGPQDIHVLQVPAGALQAGPQERAHGSRSSPGRPRRW